LKSPFATSVGAFGEAIAKPRQQIPTSRFHETVLGIDSVPVFTYLVSKIGFHMETLHIRQLCLNSNYFTFALMLLIKSFCVVNLPDPSEKK
jgi:hypothetical protein